MQRMWHIFIPFLVLSLVAAGCSAPRYDASTLEGRKAIIDATNLALNSGDCAAAIIAIESLYNSSYSDNEARLARAAAQGCAAGVANLVEVTTNLGDHISEIAGPGFWKVMTQLFYHSSATKLDSRIAAGMNATDALMAAVAAGTVVGTANRVNSGTPNVGSVVATDRIDDANFFMIYISMALVGGMQSRYGAPDPDTFARGQILGASSPSDAKGWTSVDNVDETACAYAGAVVNLLDSIEELSTKLPAEAGEALSIIGSAFSTLIDNACDAGCRSEDLLVDGLNYKDVGCGSAVGYGFESDHLCKGTGGRPCLLALRNRACNPVPDTQAAKRARCATAGVANFVSRHILGWQE